MNIDNKFRFDLWLYNEMAKRDWNTLDMAEHSGLSKQAIMYLLKDKRNPTMYTLQRIMKAFDMHLEIVQN